MDSKGLGWGREFGDAAETYGKIGKRPVCPQVPVARHLAEASYWILRKQESYRAPHSKQISSRNG
ncbi:MAG: hypothetical protein WA530_04325 [Candidatus Acidiferrum sp.]